MNLLNDPWLPIQFSDGSVRIESVAAILDPNAVELVLPRADFKGAAYQFLTGVLQTCMAPGDRRAWADHYNKPPELKDFQESMNQIAHAFNTTGDGPLFMQDFEELEVKSQTPVAALLIDSPGENGIKNNTDFFVKRGRVAVMSWQMANLALFTLQINAPAGGQGIRTGLRGGGPITTLIQPEHHASLWQRLWLNVINRRDFRYEDPDFHSDRVFPWLGLTKISDKGAEIHQSDVHELCMYWAMPRRVRMAPIAETGICDLSGASADQIVRGFAAKNYGNNYSGNWRHPLTAYKWDPKKPDQEPLSIKGQPGGITYKTWDVLTLTVDGRDVGQQAARVVGHFYDVSESLGDMDIPRLWAFGYDLDKMKPRGWYSSELPLFNLSGIDQANLFEAVEVLQKIASDILYFTRTKVKEAWYESPANAKGDTSFIDAAYWQRTESAFFNIIAKLVARVSATAEYDPEPDDANDFYQELKRVSMALFDEYAFADLGDQRTMKKRVLARRALQKSLNWSKAVQGYRQRMKIEIKPLNKMAEGVNK